MINVIRENTANIKQNQEIIRKIRVEILGMKM